AHPPGHRRRLRQGRDQAGGHHLRADASGLLLYGPEAAQRRLGITVDAAATPTPADFRAAVTGIPLALVAVDLLTASVTNERTSR
ncbi:hypothetical protein ACWEK7_28185, partial [Streptomyces californicus]